MAYSLVYLRKIKQINEIKIGLKNNVQTIYQSLQNNIVEVRAHVI